MAVQAELETVVRDIRVAASGSENSQTVAVAIAPIRATIHHSEHSQESGDPSLTYDQVLAVNTAEP
jgi:hypothetical protein